MPRLAAAVLFALALPAVAQDGPGPAVKELEGKYTLVSLTAGGKQLPRPDSERERFEIRGDAKVLNAGTLLAIPTDPKREPDPIRIVLDPTATPKAVAFTDPMKKGGPHMYGIYKLDGKTLTICLAESDKPTDRPTDFAAAGERIVTLVLEKQADAKDKK